MLDPPVPPGATGLLPVPVALELPVVVGIAFKDPIEFAWLGARAGEPETVD